MRYGLEKKKVKDMKPCLFSLLAIIVVTIPMALVIAKETDSAVEALDKWFKEVPKMKEKVTKLHFYFHDIVSGKNPTAYTVAYNPNITYTSHTFYGLTAMADDPLTIGPKPTSSIIGRAQGLYSSADHLDLALLVTMNFVFTEGIHKGSTLSLMGRNQVFLKYREMSIVGGTGIFRLARGIAIAKTYYKNTTSWNAIVEYHVRVIHY